MLFFLIPPGSEVHIVRDGKLAHMSRGMLLLNDSSRRLPPLPYTVEKVSLSWSTETPVRKIVSKEREVLLVRTKNFQPPLMHFL